jgi:hypothetical protein
LELREIGYTLLIKLQPTGVLQQLGLEAKPSPADQNPASTGAESTKGNPKKKSKASPLENVRRAFFRLSPTAAIPAVARNAG